MSYSSDFGNPYTTPTLPIKTLEATMSLDFFVVKKFRHSGEKLKFDCEYFPSMSSVCWRKSLRLSRDIESVYYYFPVLLRTLSTDSSRVISGSGFQTNYIIRGNRLITSRPKTGDPAIVGGWRESSKLFRIHMRVETHLERRLVRRFTKQLNVRVCFFRICQFYR